MTFIRKKYLTLLSAVTIMLLPACSSDAPTPVADGTVSLTLSTRTMDADQQTEIADDNLMHTLRVVIVSKSNKGLWTVEHNRLENFDVGVRISNEMKFEIENKSSKRIYLIANESQIKTLDNTPANLSEEKMFLPDENGLAQIDNLRILPFIDIKNVAQKGLPMSSMYEVDIKHESQSMVCYVVRTLTKISLTYNNHTTRIPETGDPVLAKMRRIKLLGWTLENTADQSFLMPHVNRNTTGKYTVVINDSKSVKELDGGWIDWLVDETAKGENSANPEWLTDYEVPTLASHSAFEYLYDRNANAPDAPEIYPKDDVSRMNSTYSSEAVYLSESRNEDWYDDDERPDDSLKLQQYRLTVITHELDLYDDQNNPVDPDNPDNWKSASYTAVLPNLSSLFRNTHVKVNITFIGAGQFAIHATIVPWATSTPVTGDLVPEPVLK